MIRVGELPDKLTEWLDSGLEPDQDRALRAVALVGREMGVPMYLVGGAVRDVLLTGHAGDLDFVVVGDALQAGLAVAEGLGGTVRLHSEFLSATVCVGSLGLDLTTARREIYPSVASLPEVEPASLSEDFLRRDFTLNAMAVELEADSGRCWLDPLGGQGDLAAGHLRILHNASFRDDPTRAFRGVRFEARLGLKLEAETENLVREIGPLGYLKELSGSRAMRELRSTLALPSASRCLERLQDLGLLQALVDGLEFDASAQDRLARVDDLLERSTQHDDLRFGADLWKTRWIVWLQDLSSDGASALADRLDIRGRQRAELTECRRRRAAAAILNASTRPSPHEIVAAVSRLSDAETVAVTSGISRERQEIVLNALRIGRRIQLTLGGSDLVARGYEPGPAIGRAIRLTREARLDGVIRSDQELEFAVSILEAESGLPPRLPAGYDGTGD